MSGRIIFERNRKSLHFYVACVISVTLICAIGMSKNNSTAKEGAITQRRIHVVGAPEQQNSLSYVLATHESYGFFTDISDDTWQMYQQRARNEPIYNNDQPAFSTRNNSASALWLLFNVDPIFTCPHMRRVGGRGDGPKWTCDPHRLQTQQQTDCLIYSIGSMGIYRFEDGLIETLQSTHCEIHVFDPNPKYERSNDAINKNIHYHPWGLKTESDADPGLTPNSKFYGMEFLSLQEIMSRLGHTDRRIDIFKIDCEGCEVTSYVDFVHDSVDIRQILIETHFGLWTNVTSFFDRFLDHGFVPFSKEANTHPKAGPPGCLFEWGFIKLHPDFLQRQPRHPTISQ